MQVLQKCPLCDGKSLTPVWELRDRMYALPGEFTLVQCSGCRLRFLNPQPSIHDLEVHYPQQYYRKTVAVTKDDPLIRSYEATHRVFFGPPSRGTGVLRWLLWPLNFLFTGSTTVPGERFLDVGCGDGTLLGRMRRYGMRAFGVEPGIRTVRRARELGREALCGIGTCLPFKGNSFRVVTMHHTLEHLHSPKEALREVFRVLKPGGTFHVSVPNRSSLAAAIFGRYWMALDPPRHLFAFAPRHLRQLARECGFSLGSFHCRPALVQGYLGSFHYWFSEVTHRDGRLEASRLMRSRWRLLLLPLSFLFSALGFGDSMELVLTKPKELS